MRDFDELLDGVLRQDGLAEPRGGLEERVMARVRAEDGHRSVLGLQNRRWSWLLVPAAACLGIVMAIWYVPGGRVARTDRVASRGSAPLISVRSGQEIVDGSQALGGSGRAFYPSQQAGRGPRARDAHHTTPPASWQGLRLIRDKAAAKMGHPVYRGIKRVQAAPEEPKLESFPAVSQKGDIAGWLGGDDGGKLAAIARQASPETVAAYQQLRAVQNEPIDIAAIEIKPLQQGSI